MVLNHIPVLLYASLCRTQSHSSYNTDPSVIPPGPHRHQQHFLYPRLLYVNSTSLFWMKSVLPAAVSSLRCQFRMAPLSFSANTVASSEAQPLLIDCCTCQSSPDFIVTSHRSLMISCSVCHALHSHARSGTLIIIFRDFDIIEKIFVIISPLGFWTSPSLMTLPATSLQLPALMVTR